jgi:alpha-tubulin suppressor-like RCC1 family protein
LAVVVAVAAAGGLAQTPASAAPNGDPGAGYAWGGDMYRQLGNGELIDAYVRTPTAPAGGLTGIDRIAATVGASLVRDGDGWKAWGEGTYGQFCDGSTDTHYAPAPAGIPASATAVASRNSGLLFLNGGNVFVCGANDGHMFGVGGVSESTTPLQVPGLPAGGIAKVFAGEGAYFATQSNGTVWGWGSNSNGSLGIGVTGLRVTPVTIAAWANARAISSYAGHTLALMPDGTVRAAGANTRGELGDGTTTRRLSPVPVAGLTDVVEIATGFNISMALKDDGTVWTWGSDDDGALGTGAGTDALTPQQVPGLPPIAHIAAGDSYLAALTTDGEVFGWGFTNPATLGLGGFRPPTVVEGLDDAVAIAAAPGHLLALRADDTVVAWGFNGAGAIGTGVLPPDFSPQLSPAPVVAPGDAGLIAIEGGLLAGYGLTEAGAVLAWGSNGAGQLGTGGDAMTSVPTPVSGLASGVTAIAAGYRGGYAVTADGTVMAWGDNSRGSVGDGTTENRRVPVAVTGLGGPVATIAAGDAHVVAAMPDGTVRAWGANDWGQLGDGTLTDRPSAVTVPGVTGVVAVGAGDQNSYAITATGELYTWGRRWDSSTPAVEDYTPHLVTGLPAVVSVDEGSGSVAAVGADGSVWTWGWNGSGQLGDGTTTSRATPQAISLPARAVRVSVGQHSLALLDDGSVWGWGWNEMGQLGTGVSTPFEATPVQVPGLPPVVVAVSAGLFSSYAIAGADTTSRVSIGSLSVAEGNASSMVVSFPVTLSRPAPTRVRVSYTTVDGSATQPDDYLAKTGTVVFNPGETAKTVTVRVYGDVAEEADETFTVSLTGVVSGFAVLEDAVGTATITNDDAVSVVSVAPAQVAEAHSASQLVPFAVTLDRPATSTIRVTYATSDGTATAGEDYVAASGTLTFLAGESSKTISVRVTGDPIEEADETFHVGLTGVTAPGALGTASVDGVILNDDVTAVASISDAQVVEGNTGARNIVFTVTLSRPVTGVVRLTYATADGSAVTVEDYTAETGTVSFAAGVVSRTVGISVVGDRVVEPDETLTVTLTAVTQGPATIGQATGTGTIVNTD